MAQNRLHSRIFRPTLCRVDPLRRIPPVLIVDGDHDQRYLLSRQIRRNGFNHHVDEAASGIAAIDYFKGCLAGETPFPCVVFLDIELPGMDGLEVLAWARLKQVCARTILLMYSGRTDRENVIEAFRRGAHAYLGKNSGDVMLRQLLETALSFTPRADKLAALRRFEPRQEGS